MASIMEVLVHTHAHDHEFMQYSYTPVHDNGSANIHNFAILCMYQAWMRIYVHMQCSLTEPIHACVRTLGADCTL